MANLNLHQNLNLVYETLWTGVRSGSLISMLGKLSWFCLTCLMTICIEVKMNGSVLEKKSSFKMLGLTFSSKLVWGSYMISISKTASKKIGALIRSKEFLSPEIALYLCKSTICPYMEYCCHVWAGAPSCYLELLDKLQKRICRTVAPSLAVSLEPLAHLQNVASISLFYRYYFGRCSSELARLVPLVFLEVCLLVIPIDCMIFFVTILRCCKDVYGDSFFPAQLDSGILCF